MPDPLDYDIPAIVPAGLVAYAVSRGAPPDEVFRAVGLAPAALADPENPVRAHVMMPLWRLLLDRFPGEAITLEMAEGTGLSFLGLAGQLIRHSPNVRIGIERTLRYQRLYDPALSSTFNVSGRGGTFTISHVDEVRRIGVSLEFMAAVALTCLRQLVGERIGVVEVQLESSPRTDPAHYERWFGGPVRFEQPQTALVIDPALLERPVIGADPQVLRYLSAYADGLLAQRPETERHLPLPERVRAAIERGVLEGDVAPQAIARRLGMSTRTMQRHLAASGLRFQAICDQVREQLALKLLREPTTPIHEVAFALGYGDVPSFYRAFRRWTGRTPADVRRDLAARA